MSKISDEEKARLRDNLARGRETARLNREAKAASAARASAPADEPAAEDQGEDEGDEALLRAAVIDPAEPEPAAMDAERRARLLEGVDPAIAELIGDEELLAIEAEERQRAEAERKKQALGSVRAQLRQRARVENDLISADVLRSDEEKKRLAEPVRFRVTVPGGGAGHGRDHGFRVDGRVYQQGRVYTEPRAVFDSLQSNHYGAWLSETKFRTLDQHKAGQSAPEVLAQTMPRFEVAQ